MLTLLAAILPSIFSTIDKAVPDKDKAEELKAKVQLELMNNQAKELEGAAKIIVAEAQGHSWLQRNWRPMLMCMFGFIIANNFILYPYMSLFTDKVVMLDTPKDLWDLIKIGLGGYVLGRSGEKIAKEFKSN